MTRAELELSYFTALGQFVHWFAQCEGGIHNGFHTFIGVPLGVARAIKGQAKASDLISIILPALPHTKHAKAEKDELVEIFRQFTHISDFRNKVLHRGALLNERNRFTSTNFYTRKTVHELQVAEFALSDLEAAISDLMQIVGRLTRVQIICLGKTVPPEVMPQLSPWLYKQVQLRKVGLAPPETPQAQPPQPPPSPA